MTFDISEDQIKRTETGLGRKLPPIYRGIMMKRNGGSLLANGEEWELHPLKDTSERGRAAQSVNHVFAETEAAQEWRAFPNGAVAIGSNEAGDVMMLLRSPSNPEIFADQIFVFFHETGRIKFLAEDLSVFEIR